MGEWSEKRQAAKSNIKYDVSLSQNDPLEETDFPSLPVFLLFYL